MNPCPRGTANLAVRSAIALGICTANLAAHMKLNETKKERGCGQLGVSLRKRTAASH